MRSRRRALSSASPVKSRAQPVAKPFRIPASIRQLLGPPALTPFEDADAYERLLVWIADAIRPRDAVEWLWVRDLVDLTWDQGRLRRAKATILVVKRDDAIDGLLGPAAAPDVSQWQIDDARDAAEVWLLILQDSPIPKSLTARFGYNEQPRGARLARRLAEVGLDPAAVDGEAFRLSLAVLERLEALNAGIGGRRDAIARDVYRRRDAQRRRRSWLDDEIIEVEFEE